MDPSLIGVIISGVSLLCSVLVFLANRKASRATAQQQQVDAVQSHLNRLDADLRVLAERVAGENHLLQRIEDQIVVMQNWIRE